jgi:ComEC/Rec2-related protein
MKRPLAVVALLYVGGILLADRLPLSLFALFAAGFPVGVAAWLLQRGRPMLLGLLLVLAGAVRLTLDTAELSPHDLRRLFGDGAHEVTVRGVLKETPVHRLYERGAEPALRTYAEVRMLAVKPKGADWQPATGLLATSTPGALAPELCGGQTVEIAGVLRPPLPPVVEGLFDYRTYLRRHGIHYQLHVAGPEVWQARSPAVRPPLPDRFSAWAKRTLRRGLPEEDEPLRLLYAMTLGWRTALSGEVSQVFMRSGTMHIFAISGLHIALIASILASLLRVGRVPRGACGVVVIPLLWFYTAATGWQASAIRATIMMTVILTGWSLNRPSDLLNSLAAAAFFILLWEPQQLFQASFQLSFCVVLSLGLFLPALETLWKRVWRPDPLLPAELRPRWQRILTPPGRFLATGLGTSTAAWLGSMPLTAHYFHLFTPVSLLANLAIVPLSGLALMSSLGSLLVGGWWAGGAGWFNHSAWFWMLLMVRLSEWFSGLPGAWRHVAAPEATTFGAYYALLLALTGGWLLKRATRWWLAAGLAVAVAVWGAQWQTQRATTRLVVLPLNGGHALFARGPALPGNWLIDCGNPSAVEFITLPFLHAQGVNRLATVVFTHGDARHVGGAEQLRQNLAVNQIGLSPVRFRSPAYRRLQDSLTNRPGLALLLRRGDRVGPWTVLHPEAGDRFSQADDASLVLRGEFEGVRVLLVSDLGHPGQAALLQRGEDLRADLVVTGLPTQSEPLTDDFLRAVAPRVIIVADDDYPAPARASRGLQQRLARSGVPVLYTRETGALTLTLRRGRWSITGPDGVPLVAPTPGGRFRPAASPARPRDGPGG